MIEVKLNSQDETVEVKLNLDDGDEALMPSFYMYAIPRENEYIYVADRVFVVISVYHCVHPEHYAVVSVHDVTEG